MLLFLLLLLSGEKHFWSLSPVARETWQLVPYLVPPHLHFPIYFGQINLPMVGDNDPFNIVKLGNEGIPWIYTYCHLLFCFTTRCEVHSDIDSVFQQTMDNRLKGSSLMVLNKDLDTKPNSEGSQFTKPSTTDQHLSTLMGQRKAMVALLQSSVDEQKKDTNK